MIDENTKYHVVDGIKYCDVCNEPLEAEFHGQKVSLMCACQAEKQREKDAEEEANFQANKRIMRRNECFYSVRFKDITFKNDDAKNPSVTKIVKRYVEKFQELKKNGRGLVFTGNVGSGKTFMAACIANALIDDGYSVKMANLPELGRKYMGTEFSKKDEFINRLIRYDLLIIDDYGTEVNTDYMTELAYQIINGRYNRCVPTIITTNQDMHEMGKQNIAIAKINDRLFETCYIVEVKTTKSRRAIAKEKKEAGF